MNASTNRQLAVTPRRALPSEPHRHAAEARRIGRANRRRLRRMTLASAP